MSTQRSLEGAKDTKDQIGRSDLGHERFHTYKIIIDTQRCNVKSFGLQLTYKPVQYPEAIYFTSNYLNSSNILLTNLKPINLCLGQIPAVSKDSVQVTRRVTTHV